MIKLIVNKQELSIVTSKVVAGTHQYLTVEGDFKGHDWDGLRKWVHFTMGSFNYIIPMQDDKIEASAQLDLTEGTWEVYVHGNLISDSAVTERITTDIQLLFVDAPHDGHPFPALTPDFEELLANQVAEANEISQSIRDDADSGELDGATFIPDVSDEGIISWTNNKCLENPVPRNIKGPKGDTGDSGVYIGHEPPTDPVKSVWIDPLGGAGKVIVNDTVTGTHAPGTHDLYHFDYSDGTDLDIDIYNPINGDGTGDMVRNIYDTHQHATDIFDYVDSKSDVFVATYGTTTFADIKDAYDDGKHVFAVKDNTNSHEICPLSYISSNSAVFCANTTTALINYTVNENGWTRESSPVVTTSNVRSSVDSNIYYPPTSKAVKDYVDNTVAGVDNLFPCTYGTTTYAEITAALTAGKLVYLDLDNRFVLLTSQTTGSTNYYNFEAAIGTTNYKYRVSNADVWTQSTTVNITNGNIGSYVNITVDNTVSANSSNPVKSSGIYDFVMDAISDAQEITVDSAMSNSSTNPVQNKAIKQYIDSKTSSTAKDVKVLQVPVSANTMYDSYLLTGSLNCAISGYTPIGVVGMQCNTPTIYLCSHYVNGNYVYFGVSDCHGNGFSQGASVPLTLFVLYKAN